jgi:integrase/recombinase XerC
MQWRAAMLADELSPATINQRMAALRSVLKIAKTIGLIDWTLEVKGVKSESYRDTKGPSLTQAEALIAVVRAQKGPISLRNEAIVRLMYDRGLRRAEVASLNIEDIDIAGRRISVLRKARKQQKWLTLPDATLAALQSWLAVRDAAEGPVFVHIDRHRRMHDRVSGTGLYFIIKSLAAKAGFKARPHGLRHAAITAAIIATKGDVVAVQQFSDHAKVDTVMLYYHNASDVGGAVADMVAGTLSRRA